jgi:hypothetical protein
MNCEKKTVWVSEKIFNLVIKICSICFFIAIALITFQETEDKIILSIALLSLGIVTVAFPLEEGCGNVSWSCEKILAITCSASGYMLITLAICLCGDIRINIASGTITFILYMCISTYILKKYSVELF